MNDLVVSKSQDVAAEHQQGHAPLVSSTSDAALNSRLMLQYQVAERRPRKPSKVRDNLVEIVTLDPESAQESMYALPRAGKPVIGPSIRFAEALKQAWGNCWVSSEVRTINREEKYVESIGLFIDFETNAVTEFTHQRSIAGRNGRIFSDDMIRVTANAASSIAMREAILKGVPKPIWRAAWEAVQKIIAGDVMTLVENREKAIRAFAVYGVKPEQVFAALGIADERDVTLEHITVLRGMFSALRSGEETVENMFRPQGQKEAEADPNRNPLVKEKVDQTTGEVTTGTEAQRTAQDKAPPHASGEESLASDREPDSSGSETRQADASPSSQSDLLSTDTPSGDSKGEASPQGQTEGAGGQQPGTTPAPDRLLSYSKALAGIENGGPPKLGKQGDAWTTKNGPFTGDDDKKRSEIYAAHLKRITGEIDAAACAKIVEEIVAR